MTHPPSFTVQGGTSPGNLPPRSPLHQPPVHEPRNLWAPQRPHLKYGLTIPVAPGTWGANEVLQGKWLAHAKGNKVGLGYLLNQVVKIHMV